jgi:hypothetical protein
MAQDRFEQGTPTNVSPAAPSTPFEYEQDVLHDRVAIRDELSQAQGNPSAARRLSARHVARLIYSLQYQPGAVERHTAPYSPESLEE